MLRKANMAPLEVTQNYYFSIVSSILMAIVVTVVTVKITQKRLGVFDSTGINADNADEVVDDAAEARGLTFAGYYLAGFAVIIALLTAPPGAPLRDAAELLQQANVPAVVLLLGIPWGPGAPVHI